MKKEIMETITIHPKNKEQADLFEQLAKVLKVRFEKPRRLKVFTVLHLLQKLKGAGKIIKKGKGF